MKRKLKKKSPETSYFYSSVFNGRSENVMLQARKKELAHIWFTPQQSFIIFIIYTLKKTTLNELAQVTNRGINTLSSEMTTLERDGLVKKTREKPKSTLLSFELTEKGTAVYKSSNKGKATTKIMSV